MKTTLITLNYNDYETTSGFINSIKSYKTLDLIVVVDNNSTDNSYKELKKLENKKIVVLKSDKNGGYGYGNNIGIKYIEKKYKDANIIISNPDIEIKEEVIKKLNEDLNKDEKYALVGPVINTNGKISKAWKLTSGFKELLISIPLIGKLLKENIIGYKNSYYNMGTTEVDCVSGCFFACKLSAIKDIDYYDENLFLYYEENVISKKLKDKGYKVIFDNTIVIKHNHSVTIDKNHSNLSKYKILKQSQMYYLDNYTSASKLSKKMIRLISRIMIRLKK